MVKEKGQAGHGKRPGGRGGESHLPCLLLYPRLSTASPLSEKGYVEMSLQKALAARVVAHQCILGQDPLSIPVSVVLSTTEVVLCFRGSTSILFNAATCPRTRCSLYRGSCSVLPLTVLNEKQCGRRDTTHARPNFASPCPRAQ